MYKRPNPFLNPLSKADDPISFKQRVQAVDKYRKKLGGEVCEHGRYLVNCKDCQGRVQPVVS